MTEQTAPRDYYRTPALIAFPRPYRYATVAANSNETVFEWNIPVATVAFVQRLANNLYEDGYWRFLFDNMPFHEEDRIEYVLGHVNAPFIVEPPVLVKRHIRIIYYNQRNESVNVECLCDGVYGPDRNQWRLQPKTT